MHVLVNANYDNYKLVIVSQRKKVNFNLTLTSIK